MSHTYTHAHGRNERARGTVSSRSYRRSEVRMIRMGGDPDSLVIPSRTVRRGEWS